MDTFLSSYESNKDQELERINELQVIFIKAFLATILFQSKIFFFEGSN